MGYLNYEFFDEYKALDNLCRDIYGESPDKKLGVSMYIEDMEKNFSRGSFEISGWESDYNHLKYVRNIRNELAQSRNSITVDICSHEDIDFVRFFRARILNQTDPIAMLRKQVPQTRPAPTLHQQQPQPTYTYNNVPSKAPVGCLGIVVSFLIIIACVIEFLL